MGVSEEERVLGGFGASCFPTQEVPSFTAQRKKNVSLIHLQAWPGGPHVGGSLDPMLHPGRVGGETLRESGNWVVTEWQGQARARALEYIRAQGSG